MSVPQRFEPEPVVVYEPVHRKAAEPEGLDGAMKFVRRRYPVIVGTILLALVIGAYYLAVTPSKYTAAATMLIDSRKGQVYQSHPVLGDAPMDSSWVDSEIGVLALARDKVGVSVAKQLHLVDNPLFNSEPPDVFASLAPYLGPFATKNPPENPVASKGVQREADLLPMVSAAVAGCLDVKRIGLSFLVTISFCSGDPAESVRVANAAADAFVSAEMDTKFQEVRRASDWLQQRYTALAEEVLAAERAVDEFKRKNNIVTSGGKIITEQQTDDLNAKLAQARARTAETFAKLQQIETVIETDSVDPTANRTVSESLNDQIITTLRSKYLELANREADWAPRYGKHHLAVIDLQNKMAAIKLSIVDELRRIMQSYNSDYQVAAKNQKSLELEVEKVGRQIPNEVQIKLRALQSSAESYRTFYNNFLLNYREAVQQESSPVSETRVVAYASYANKSFPSTGRVAGFTLFAGIALGVALGMLQDALDRSFRTREHVRKTLNEECIALIPATKRRRTRISFASPDSEVEQARTKRVKPFTGWIINEDPPSLFADSIAEIELAVDVSASRSNAKIVGFASSVAREGKSTVALAFARLRAKHGARCILVDLDFRHPSLSQTLTSNLEGGVVSVLSGETGLNEAILEDAATGLYFLPAGRKGSAIHSPHLLGGEAIKTLFDQLRLRFDYIVVDLPPLSPIVDVRATSRFVDLYILVVEWGQTKIEIAQQCLRDAPNVREKLLGVVLNKVDTKLIGRYDATRTKYYCGMYTR